jgi:hypothetical protein
MVYKSDYDDGPRMPDAGGFLSLCSPAWPVRSQGWAASSLKGKLPERKKSLAQAPQDGV